MFHLTLRDLVLFCHKDEKTAAYPASFESPQSAMRLHHGLATAASDYSKKQFVFRLRTCDRAEYLFQVLNPFFSLLPDFLECEHTLTVTHSPDIRPEGA